MNVRYEDGQTPIHLAAKTGNLEIANLLAENGADVNVESAEGYSPLFIACKEGNQQMFNQQFYFYFFCIQFGFDFFLQ